MKLNKKIAFPQTFDGSIFLNSDGNLDADVVPSTVSSDDTKNEGDNNKNKLSKMEYELYSMLIHTGGATGGHYFAYIKDFDSGKWMQFNDSNVQEIPTEEIEKWFSPRVDSSDSKESEGNNTANVTAVPAPIPTTAVSVAQKQGNGLDIAAAIAQNVADKQKKDVTQKIKDDAKKRPRFLDPYGAAYMLMYRKVDNERNVMTVSNDAIPQNVVDDIKEKDAIFAKQKAEYDRLRQYTTLKVHYDGKVSDVMVKKKETMHKALEKIYDEMKLSEKGVVNVQCIRLRNMRVLNAVPLEPYDGDKLEDLVESFKFHDPKHLMLETRGETEEFAVWEKEKVSIRMIELDEGAMEWKKVCCDAMIILKCFPFSTSFLVTKSFTTLHGFHGLHHDLPTTKRKW